MKKILIVITAILAIFVIIGCGSNSGAVPGDLSVSRPSDERIAKAQKLAQIGDTEVAIEIVKEVVSDRPEVAAEAYTLFAAILLKNGEVEEAGEKLNFAVSSGVNARSVADELTKLATTLECSMGGLQIDLRDEAIPPAMRTSILEIATEVCPTILDEEEFAFLYYVKSDYLRADEFLEKFPKSPKRAEVLLEAGNRYDNARAKLEYYDKVIAEFPDTEWAKQAAEGKKDLWFDRSFDFPLQNHTQTIRGIKIGERLRLRIDGEWQVNAFGAEHSIDARSVWIYNHNAESRAAVERQTTPKCVIGCRVPCTHLKGYYAGEKVHTWSSDQKLVDKHLVVPELGEWEIVSKGDELTFTYKAEFFTSDQRKFVITVWRKEPW